jgi:cytochrome P450 PksS
VLADSELSKALNSGEFFKDPYPFFAKFRVTEPIFYSEALGGWVLLRYQEIDEVLRNHEIYSSKGRVLYLLQKLDPGVQQKLPLLQSHFAYGLAHSDAPEHRRLRTLLAQAFTPRFVNGFKPHITKVVNQVISSLESEFDLIEDVFVPIPALVVGKLLGSSQSDVPDLIRWAGAINGLYEKGGNISAQKALYAEEMLEQIRSFVLELVNQRRLLREKGKLDPNTDVLSGLVAAEVSGDSLSEAELVSTVVTLFVAGHETTTHLLGNGFYALFNNPDQLDLYRNNLELAENLIDEMARFDGSVPRSWRINKVEVEIAGAKIPANSMILPMLASANRDPLVFENPEEFQIKRDSKKHLAFGKGVHVCLGAPLARIEGQEIANALIKQKPKLEITGNLKNLGWRRDIALRGLISLPAIA